MLKNKIILVTGASKGIGREAAITFAKEGARVILLGRNSARLEQTYDAIVNAGYKEPSICPFDFSTANPDAYQTLAQNLEKEYGRLDGLLHNAAMLGNLCPIEHYDIRIWYTVMQTNVHAPFLLTQVMIPLLKKSPSASLLFTLADEGEKGSAYWGAYGVSKSALRHLMEILRDELENTFIRVHAINPGIVRTGLRAKAFPLENAEQHPWPSEIMEKYVVLMRDD